MGDEWRVSERDQPWANNDVWVLELFKYFSNPYDDFCISWSMGDEWRVSERDQPWVNNDVG
jgi:hypothetical protein